MQRHVTLISILAVIASLLAGCMSGPEAPTAFPTPYPFITATPQGSSLPQATASTPPLTSPIQQVTPLPQQTGPTAAGTTSGTPTVTATARPGLGCRYQPQGVFASVYQGDPGLPLSLGCAIGQTSGERPRLWPVTIEFQSFERGYMLWVSNLGWLKSKAVFAMLDDQTFTRYDDTFDPAKDPSGGSATPPGGLLEPVNALGKVWRSQPGLSARIGSALAPSSRIDTQMQVFEYGQMIYAQSSGQMIVLKQGMIGSWSLHPANQ